MEAAPPATPRHTMFPYGCSLPGLTRLTGNRCGGTDGATTTARHVTSRAIVPVWGEVTTSASRKNHHFSMTCPLRWSDGDAVTLKEGDKRFLIQHLDT